MKKNILAALILSLCFTTISFAGTKTPVIKTRQNNQQERIAQGLSSGSLSARETARLEANQAKIQQDKKEAKSNGIVTNRERAKLEHEQNRSSAHIYRAKHN